MKRLVLNELHKWKDSKRRKPLIVKGARQVGKTWALQEFGRSFADGYAYFNFDKEPEYNQFFQSTKDVRRIMQNLAMASGQKITPDTLIIFDEIQACPEALNSLKYFCEDGPEYYVASAGSLLGIKLAQGFPVGKVDFLEMGPMTFTEYLMADGSENLAAYLSGINDFSPIPDAFFNPLIEKLKMYFVVGGMPEPVLVWTEDQDIREADRVLSNIIMSYENDFAKHAEPTDVPKIQLIWDSLPSQLARENKKFQISKVASGARFRDYRGCAEWLSDAGMVNICYCMEFPELPLGGNYEPDTFKLYFADTGLLVSMLDDESQEDLRANKNLGVYKGALYENMVGEALIKQGYKLFYYKKENSTLEADFFIRSAASLIPVEVKAKSGRAKSMKTLITSDHYPDIRYGIKFSKNNIGHEDRIYTFPYFCTFLLKRFMVGFHAEEEAE